MFIEDKLYQEIQKVLPIICVDVLIVREGKCLLLFRDNEPAKGMYWFPGGRIYKNEIIEQAAIRKAKEETGLDCLFEKIISTEQSIFIKNENMATDIHTINICCLMNITTNLEIKLDHLHTGYKWVDTMDSSYHNAVLNPLKILGFNF